MAGKFFLVLCASALFIQTISANCGCGYGNIGAIGNIGTIGNIGAIGYNNAYNGLAGYGGCGGIGYASPAISASGGGLAVSSASPISPNGISVVSDNAIEGALEVVGSLPLLAAVALEGNVPSAGSAGVSYSCGNGQVGIASESLSAAGLGAAGLGSAGLGYGAINAGRIGANLAGAELAGLNAGLYGGRIGRPCGCGY